MTTGEKKVKTHDGSYVDNSPSLELVSGNALGHDLAHINYGLEIDVKNPVRQKWHSR